ncbi:MAG TPA: redoxin domain-containing protein [Pirellulales bacterium]|nr:redoxin domain-containing protein [Pirellulales bacterium]
MPKIALAIIVLLIAMGSSSAAAESSPIGKKVDNFSARDFRGKVTSLDDFAGSKIVVVAFLGTECPLAKQYGPRLVEVAAAYKDKGVAVLGIDSNQQDSVSEIAHYAQEHKIEFPLLKDAGNVIADQLSAVRTPEVFVLDASRTVRYWGRVDNQFGFQEAGVAYQRSQPNRRDLTIALDELLAGKDVSQSVSPNQGCRIGRVRKPLANSEVTYSKHIAPIFNNNCVYCHRDGQIAPFPLTSYEESVGWAEMIREVVDEHRMPPWHADPKVGHFKNDARLSDRDQALIDKWVENGAPQGDPKDMPPAPQYAAGWRIPKPDAVVYMSEQGHDVPATGTVEYQRFVVDPGWTEDKWIKALECIPGNPAVVHHIIVYLVPPGVTPSGQAGRLRTNWLGAFAPGLRQQVLADGLARYVQAGSKLLFEMHYTPNGVAQKDRSYAGFVFADPKTVKQEVAVQNAGNFTFKIPPGDDNYEVESEFVFRQNALLLTISPHMHVRGKDFRYELIYPDGKLETLLWVPHYDFGWQTTYELSEPKVLPKGTKMHCVAHFDNSADNFANPDPTKEVTWGEQTWEEMMFGWFEMALADQDLTQPATASALRVKEFLGQADTVKLDDQLRSLARGALASDKTFERFAWQLFELVPQLDRICVTSVDNDKLRLKTLMERFGLKTSLKSRSTVVRAKGQSLADYALGDKVVVNQEMNGTKGSVMTNMAAKDIRSSMHVPVVIKGTPCTINFWSAEAGGFPPEAVKLLEPIARLMAEGAEAVAQK